jgi:RimJ/RimL family protein N-acetyltransferase
MRPIFTPRLLLEPQTAAHAEAMFEVLSDPAIYEHENAPPPSLGWLRERFARLASRRSPDGAEQWLNWVVRLPAVGLIGYVQATVAGSGAAAIAYEMNSRHWGHGYAGEAVQAMIDELAARHGVTDLRAVLKQANRRSARLLERLGFAPATTGQRAAAQIEPDEWLMVRRAPAA